MTEQGLPYPQVFDGKAWKTELTKAYGVWGIPSVFLIDREGVIRGTGLRGQALNQALAQLMATNQ